MSNVPDAILHVDFNETVLLTNELYHIYVFNGIP